jgi:WxcM-like, C-terminal
MAIADCRLIDLPKINDARGNLTFIEGERHLPFPIRRVFYLYDVPGGSTRAGHALRTCHQFIVSLSGAFDVLLDDGAERQRFHLNRSHYGLYVTPLIWRELDNFSSNSVCLVLASEEYEPAGYLREYEDFLAAVRDGG